jgi:long-chain acyl-CoA synthetase
MDRYETFPELLNFITRNYISVNIFNYRINNSWKGISTEEFFEMIQNISLGLLNLGVNREDKIGIISNPSPFWIMSDLGIILSGCITVPIFRRISPENLKFEIEDSGLEIIFIGDVNEYDSVKLYGKRIKKIITIGFKINDPISISLEELIESGKSSDKLPEISISENDIVTIIYTSGSTGIPKGVMLTHKNIISQIKSAAICFSLDKDNDTALSSLPLSHIFERMVMYFYLSEGIPVFFVDDLNSIGSLITEVKPTIMTAVPRLLEKIYERILEKSSDYKGLKKIIAMHAFKRAETRTTGSKITIMDFIYRKLVYSKIIEVLGGNFKYIISGAASLPLYIGNFFNNIGLPLYEGYGMTEASPVISCNRKKKIKIGTVGINFPSVSIKINDDGEILATGPNVMKGYHNNPAETSKVIDTDGFLHTGDLGKIDDEGYLTITGRKKELFKKSTGEYVAPVPIEQALSRIDIVDTAMVIAESRKFVTCLLFPDFEKVRKVQEKEGFGNISMEEFLDSGFINKRISDFIHEMNTHLHHTEEVQKFKIIKKPISIETGELTPTLKIMRNIIEKKFINEINEMYKD